MRCSQARKRLAVLVDSDRSDAEVDAHVDGCGACASFLAIVKGADSVLASVGPAALPPDLAARVADVALTASAQPARELFVDRLVPVAWPAAALAVAAAVLLFFSAGYSGPAANQLVDLEDPVTTVTLLPLELADPTRALIGGEE